MTPQEFAAKINEWARGPMITSHGTDASADLVRNDGKSRPVAPRLASRPAPPAGSSPP